MPWARTDVGEQRVKFVVRAVSGRETMAGLCREFGISRPTGYRWRRKYEQAGSVAAVTEGSRRPRRSPQRTEPEKEERVVALRQQYGWAAKKLDVLLREQGLPLTVTTINRILRRRGLLADEARHAPALERFERAAPNELWQMDGKGPYRVSDGTCFPLSAMVTAQGDQKHGQPVLPIHPQKDALHPILEVMTLNGELRIRERQLFVFMLRFALGATQERLKQNLRGQLPSKDLSTLYSYLTGHSRCKRIRALIVIFYLYGVPRDSIIEGLGVGRRTVNKYLRKFKRLRVDSLFPPRKGVIKRHDPRYKDALFSILHSPPKDHGFNRTTWKMKDLACVMARIGMRIGKNHVGVIIRNAGYRRIKARTVLTSNDPHYREKVDRIHRILSTLKRTERFFSIDEFGPFAVKQRGGRRLVGPGDYPTVPQFQKSKGCLIVTAALELSTNQVTHFYSSGKDTREMIRLLEVLLTQYRDCRRLYLSWDAAGWHASKKFVNKVKEINSRRYRREHGTPMVKMAPLPARAQFLNVIESVFSGLAVSVVHNSDYASVDDAKGAIDRYFAERNSYFQRNPKKAGNKIWGKELVASAFREGHNCKNRRFR